MIFLLVMMVYGGGVSNRMIMVGNFRVIKALTQVMICYVSL